MHKLHLAILAAAFAATSTFAMLLSSAQHSSNVALADPNAASTTCVNPAGKTKGWCKHAFDSDDQVTCKQKGDGDNDDKVKCKSKHHNRGVTTLSGTVLSVNNNVATIRLDNGQIVNVNENGTVLNIGQHYTLNGCYQGNVFVLGCYSNGSYPGGYSQEISGTILSVNGNSLTLVGIPPTTIDVSIAVANGRTNGALVPLRHINAFGSYQNGVFYATTIQ